MRDAWPGNLGPFVESLAGKLDKRPSVALFGLLDRRSDKSDDDVDHFTVNRLVCAQLLALFLARTKDSLVSQSVGADDLDRLYHSNTEFDPNGSSATAFKKSLEITTQIFQEASSTGESKVRNKTIYKKMDVLAVFFLVQDLGASPLFRFDQKFVQTVAQHVRDSADTPKKGKSVSGSAITQYYDDWKVRLPEKLGVHVDPQRLFDGKQKEEIFARDGGMCRLCGKKVLNGEAEYDHHPVPHYLGGLTNIANGRLVCAGCHPRGRPSESAL